MCASWQYNHFWFIGVPDVKQERVLMLLTFPNYGPYEILFLLTVVEPTVFVVWSLAADLHAMCIFAL